VRQALVALHLFNKDKHYLIKDGKIQIIDEYTGRLMADRSWERGLQQLIEIKEGCEVTKRRETKARITYQRFFRRYQKLKLFKSVLLVLSVISLFAIGVEKIMIDEIAREYRQGLDINELHILNLAYITNIAFSLLVFIFLLKTFRLLAVGDTRVKNVDEIIFVISQYLGIVAGFTGLLFTLHMLRFVTKEILIDKFWVFIPFYILFLIPYLLAGLYWLSLKLKQRIEDWYDEKQLQDMLRSAFMTLLLSVPGLSLLLLFQIPHAIFVIFYYIFLIMLLFSGGTLYYFKIKDTV